MKWIIVTGHSKGLGKEIVSRLLKDTQFGVIGISRSGEEIIREWNELYPERIKHLTYDLSNPNGIKELYLQRIRKIGPLYGLVNNSATAYDEIVSNMKVDSVEFMFRVNVISAMHLTKYAIRDMILHKIEGSIVHISSVSAHTGYKGLSMYAATKGAIEAFSINIAREWGSKGIRSNCIVPGFMETSMSESLSDEQKDRIYKRTSLKKATDIDSVANAVLFLLSEQARSVTGTVFRVDNGTL